MAAPSTDPSGTLPNVEPANEYFHHDWESDDDLATKIVSAVATMTDKDETDVELLYDRVDPDSLDALFSATNADDSRSNGVLWFSLEDCSVTVYGTGFVVVQRLN